MSGSPASSTPTAMRGAPRSETPDILRDSSLLHSDESVIADQTHQTDPSPVPETESRDSRTIEGEMADKTCLEERMRGRADRVADKSTDKNEESVRKEEQESLEIRDRKKEDLILDELSEDRIRKLENRRRGNVESRMDETPIGVEVK